MNIDSSGRTIAEKWKSFVEDEDMRNPDICWLWKGAPNSSGYGSFRFGSVRYSAHRISYMIYKGAIADDKEIDHLCDNKLCVNPDHLRVVSHRDNLLRSNSQSSINGRKTHCPKGHPLFGDNLYTASNGNRRCKLCRKEQRKNKKVISKILTLLEDLV